MSRPSVLVTGAGKRIGAAIAQHFAARGYAVHVHVHRSLDEGQQVVDTIAAAGGVAYLLHGDLGNPEDIAAIVAHIRKSGRLTLVVNNASYFKYDTPLNADLDIYTRSLDAHVKGPYLLLEALREDIAQRPLDVVNILDQKIENPNPDYYSYTIGKFGLFGLTKLWSSAAIANLRVFGILPGLMLTSGEQSEENFRASHAANALERAITAQDVIAAIDFFVANRSLPSQVITVDAGESLYPRRRDIAFDPVLHDAATTPR